MKWTILIIVLFAIAMAVAAVVFVLDRRYDRKKTSEVMSPALKEEIEEERADGLRRRTKFEEAMKTAGQLEVTERTKRPIA